MSIQTPPFEAGERVAPSNLVGWTYGGLSGNPGDARASRRYTKGMWVLELHALVDKKKAAKVLSIRTENDDRQWWAGQRQN